MERHIIQKLRNWKANKARKPLILRGVRQCGKTHTLKSFGALAYPRVHYFDFEKSRDIHTIFEPNLDPKRLIEELNYRVDGSIAIDRDLVIFDEIQACPRALTRVVTTLKLINAMLFTTTPFIWRAK